MKLLWSEVRPFDFGYQAERFCAETEFDTALAECYCCSGDLLYFFVEFIIGVDFVKLIGYT